ncbi:hypothetical protein [Ruegeria marina]|uniref:hypothetical protein n=1 Tax=Ruegeria marina TaxID=639004 RepID=UPI0015A0236C|nr:hypothetical protein [Ruegeria marina]
MYSITARRMIYGLVLKQRNGDRFGMAGRYKTALPASAQFALTAPTTIPVLLLVQAPPLNRENPQGVNLKGK